MSAITQVFATCREQNRKAVIPYLTAGFPNETSFIRLVDAFDRQGADIIEVGIPFSDPLADGPTIQLSSQKALKQGMSVSRALSILKKRKEGSAPIVIMSYLNPLLQYGIDRFLVSAHEAGVRGLIIPDIICEEGTQIERSCRRAGIDLIYLLAPTSPKDRQRLILGRSRGFVYLVSVAGVTGARRALPGGLNRWVSHIKEQSPVPVAVGFGISGPDVARKIGRVADGIIVGSAIIDIIRHGNGTRRMVDDAVKFLQQLQQAVQQPTRQR
jgi:tryptophan synthase alpha chain